MKSKNINRLFLIFIFLIFTIPKFNLINIFGSSTGIRIDDFLVFIMFIITLSKNFKEIIKFKTPNASKIARLFALYIIFCIISVFFGYKSGYISLIIGIFFTIRKIEYFVLMYIGYYLYKKEDNIEDINICFNMMILCHFIFSIVQKLGLFGSFNAGTYINGLTQGRISSTFNGAYELSAFMLILLPFVLYRMINIYDSNLKIKIKNKAYIRDVFLIIMIFICILLSESRSSLFIFILIIILMNFKIIKKQLRDKKIKTILVFILMVGIFAAFNGKSLLSRFNDLSLNGFINSTTCAWKNKNFDSYIKTGEWFYGKKCLYIKADASYNLRVNHWMQLIDGFIKHPIFGLGPSVTTAAADGNYVRILVESGILGMLLWLLIIIKIFRILKHKNMMNYIVKMGLITIVLGATFIDLFEASKIMMLFWFVLGIAICHSVNELNIKSKIKNVIIVNDFNYVQGGASKVAIETAKILKDNYNVLFICGKLNDENKIDGVTYVSTNQKECLKDKNKLRGIINGLYNFKASYIMKKVLNKYDINETIIHVHGWTKVLSSSIFSYALNNNYKLTITLHDYFTVCPNGGFFDYKKNTICKLKPCSFKCMKTNCDSRNKYFKLYRLARQFIQDNIVGLKKKLRYAIGISNLNIDVLKRYLNSDIIIEKINNPIDFIEEPFIDITKNKTYLYIGRVTKEKGVELLCENSKKFKYPLTMVGDGIELEKLHKKYNNVNFVGWKDSKEVKEYIKKARIFMFPSLWYEGAPLTPLEAMNFGIPCLVSNCSSAKEYISNNGCVFDPYDRKSLIDGIHDIENNLKLYSSNSYQYVKKLRKNDYKKELIKFYDSMR